METSEKVAILSILVNFILAAFKAGLAALSGSLAIKADAIHSLTDVVSSIVILLGIRISSRSSRRFPYGLYKVENLFALGVSVLIFLAGYEIFTEAFTVSDRPLPRHIALAAAGIVLTMIITWLFSSYELKKGKETGSPSLVADARDFGTDMLTSLVILAGLLGGAVGFAVDRFAALVVALFIVRSAFGIFLDSARVLLDASLDQESLEAIRRIVADDPRAVRINALRARNAGRYKFVELDVTLRVKELAKGHGVAEEIKQRIRTSLGKVDHVQLHYEPEEKNYQVLGIPLAEDKQMVSEHFGEAPYFRLVTIRSEDKVVTRDAVVNNPHRYEGKAKGIKVANWLLAQGLDLILVRKDLGGKGPGFVLGNAEVKVLVVTEADAESALARVKESQAA